MKTILSILLALLMCITLLTACNEKEQAESLFPNIHKGGVEEFCAELSTVMTTDHSLLSGFPLDAEYCYNVTPDSVSTETSIQIFKFSNSASSFIYFDNKIYPIESFGGYGFVSAVPCDFDLDGNRDILYTYSWGSGFHHSFVAVFNTQTQESTIIYDNSGIDAQDVGFDVDFIVQEGIPALSSGEESKIYYTLSQVDIVTSDADYADLKYTNEKMIGTIELVDGLPTVVPSK